MKKVTRKNEQYYMYMWKKLQLLDLSESVEFKTLPLNVYP